MSNNTLEQHAVMLGLLAKYAIQYGGDQGRDAMIAGVARLGRERGVRMAARAVLRGDKLDFVDGQAYGEWRAAPGQMNFVTTHTRPTVITRALKCGWNDYWRKYGLLEYGKYFCVAIDAAVISGFSADLDCKTLANLSWGDEYCEFDWGVAMTEEDEARLAAKKAELGDSCVKDFNYHIGHVVHSVGGEIIDRLGQAGQDAVDSALGEFTQIFGPEYAAAFAGIYPGEADRL